MTALAMNDFLKKIQQRPEAERKMIFWILVILFGIVFFGFWLLIIKQQVDSLNKDKIRQDLNLLQMQEQFKSLPKLELPKIDEQELKTLEKLLES